MFSTMIPAPSFRASGLALWILVSCVAVSTVSHRASLPRIYLKDNPSQRHWKTSMNTLGQSHWIGLRQGRRKASTDQHLQLWSANSLEPQEITAAHYQGEIKSARRAWRTRRGRARESSNMSLSGATSKVNVEGLDLLAETDTDPAADRQFSESR